MATFLLLGDALGEGVTRVAVDEGEGVGSGEVDVGKIVDDVNDTGRDDIAEFGLREASVVEGTLVGEDGMVVCAVTGPEPRVNSRDEVEQHAESSSP